MNRKSILIIDDEKNIRMTLSRSLESPEMAVRTAVNGEEALEILGKEPSNLVFLDLKMPGMGGMETLRQIRTRWPAIRVIVITAFGTVDLAVEAMKLGAADFIQKPFSPGEIRDLAQKVLNQDPSVKTRVEWMDKTALEVRHE
jgi:DNA-binding NtrC family response regulator